MNGMRLITRRRGLSSLETIVAFTLLTSVLSLSLPLVVRHGRLLMDQRAYRVALDELSNRLDRLTTLPEEVVPAALDEIVPSEFAAAQLSGAKLSGTFEPADIGGRVILRLTWGGSVQRAVSMAGWITPKPPQSTEERSPEAL